MNHYIDKQQIEEITLNRFESTMFDLPELYEDPFETMIETDQSDWDFIEDYDDKSFDSVEADWM